MRVRARLANRRAQKEDKRREPSIMLRDTTIKPPPSDNGKTVSTTPVVAGLPAGWQKIFDENYGQHYYYHEATGVSQWLVPKV